MKESLWHSQGQILARNWAKRAFGYIALGMLSGVLVSFGLFVLGYELSFTDAQKFYYKDYLMASVSAAAESVLKPKKPGIGKYRLFTSGTTTGTVGLVVNPSDLLEVGFDREAKSWSVTYEKEKYPNGVVLSVLEREHVVMAPWFRERVFDGSSQTRLWAAPCLLGFSLFLGISISALWWDRKVTTERRGGVILRGARPVSIHRYNRETSGDLTLFSAFEAWGKDELVERDFKEYLPWSEAGRRPILVRRRDLFQHLRMVGDTGTGKSQIIRLILKMMEKAGIPVVVYDPDGRYLAEFYHESRGDIVLNPLDERFPGYCLCSEIETHADAVALAEAIFPGESVSSGTDKWFKDRTRELLVSLFRFKPSNKELLKWISSGTTIDKFLGSIETPLKEALNQGAESQRAGILGTLAGLAKVLEVLPEAEKDTGWSAKRWGGERRAGKGWVFVSTRSGDREALIPFTSAVFDSLIRRGMMHGAGERFPFALVVDELQTLQRIPKLERGLTELRKFGGIMVLGYQGDTQLESLYGKSFVTMLSQPKGLFVLRTSFYDAAERLAKHLGQAEIEKEEISTTESVTDSRDSSNYRTARNWEPVVPATLIQKLEDLQGYWTTGGSIVKFKLEFEKHKNLMPAFIPRQNADDTFWRERPEEKGKKQPKPREEEPGPSSDATDRREELAI